MVSKIKSILSIKEFSLDPYLSFYLSNRLYNVLQLEVYFPSEDLKFKCSSFVVPWENLKAQSAKDFGECKNIEAFEVENLIISELYSSELILKYLEEVANFDSGYEKGLIQIGYVEQPINFRLMYLCKGKDLGSIYIEAPDDGSLLKISSNICLLLSQGNLKIHDGNIERFNGNLKNAERSFFQDYWVMKKDHPA